MERRVVRRTQSRLEGADGVGLFGRAWHAPEPRRVLVVVHGFGEHSGRYDHLGAWFAARGASVHAYDQRGHGRSEGPRGHASSFERLLDDLDAVLSRARTEHPQLPLTLIGHSMGGLVVSALLRERRPAVTAAVTSGACLALASPPGAGRLRLARLARKLLPRLQVPAGVDPNGLSRDPEVVRRYIEDPLVLRRMSATLALELMEAIERTAAGGEKVEVPMLLAHGQDDALCAPRGTRDFHASLRNAASVMRIYPKLRHEIFNEPEQEEVFGDVLDWLGGVESSQ